MSAGQVARVILWLQESYEVVQCYKQIRENVDVEHNRIYTKAKKLAADFGSDEAMPRIIKRRQIRSNLSISSPCDYTGE